jgi:choline kinase
MSSLDPPKTAVILAAGMGSRLGSRGRAHPKGFLKLGERPIIEESLERLRQSAIDHVLIVTGHCGEWYDELAATSKGFVSTVPNPRYSDSGSMYSLYCAREHIAEDFLLLESDLIYERRAITELLAYPKDNCILLSGLTHSGDEVFVETRSDRLLNMSKDSSRLGSFSGELVGITKVSMGLFAIMLTLAEKAFATSLNYDYETDCLVEAAARYPVYCHVVSDLFWAEIDDERHLRRAQHEIYPTIIRNEWAI